MPTDDLFGYCPLDGGSSPACNRPQRLCTRRHPRRRTWRSRDRGPHMGSHSGARQLNGWAGLRHAWPLRLYSSLNMRRKLRLHGWGRASCSRRCGDHGLDMSR
ncbi:MAG TPA: hypothetical protein VF789_22540 [Thermoanaerobaculia bacterium]